MTEQVPVPQDSIPSIPQMPVIKENLPANSGDIEDALAAAAGAFLPRVQLMTSNSAAVKEREFPCNHYGIVRGQDITDIGKEVEILAITWRPKAIQMGEPVLVVYDPKIKDNEPTGAFRRIQEASEIQDSRAMWGYEHLVWLPEQQIFALLFLGSKSSRREHATFAAAEKKYAATGDVPAVLLTAKLIKTPRYSWWTMLPKVSSTPPASFPTQKELEREIEKFKNPPESAIELAEEPAGNGKRER